MVFTPKPTQATSHLIVSGLCLFRSENKRFFQRYDKNPQQKRIHPKALTKMNLLIFSWKKKRNAQILSDFHSFVVYSQGVFWFRDKKKESKETVYGKQYEQKTVHGEETVHGNSVWKTVHDSNDKLRSVTREESKRKIRADGLRYTH